MAREDVGHDAPGDVGRSTGRERHDYGHRLCRIVLRLRPADSGEHDKQRRELSSSHRPLPLSLQVFMGGTIPRCARECSHRKPGTNAWWPARMSWSWNFLCDKSCALLRISHRAARADIYDGLRAPGEAALKSLCPIAAALALIVSGWAASAETSEERQACIGDAFRVCWSAIPDRNNVLQCLVENRNRLNPRLPRGDNQIHAVAPAQGHAIRAQRAFASGVNATSHPCLSFIARIGNISASVALFEPISGQSSMATP